MGVFNGSEKPTIGFADPPFTDVVTAEQKGNQNQRSGLIVKGRFRRDNNQALVLDFKINNQTGGSIADFDIMFNKNPFGIQIQGATNKIIFPPNGGSVEGTL